MDYAERDLINQPLTEPELQQLARVASTTVPGLINPKSAVFKKMGVKLDGLDEAAALDLIKTNPRILTRPVITGKNLYMAGFSESSYQGLL